MYKLCFYVPESHLDEVKSAIFSAGAGSVGNYDHCCWQAEGRGQFRPLPGSDPYLGVQDEVTYVTEYLVEVVCKAQVVKAVVSALQDAHPYEEPAWNVVELVTELPQ